MSELKQTELAREEEGLTAQSLIESKQTDLTIN